MVIEHVAELLILGSIAENNIEHETLWKMRRKRFYLQPLVEYVKYGTECVLFDRQGNRRLRNLFIVQAEKLLHILNAQILEYLRYNLLGASNTFMILGSPGSRVGRPYINFESPLDGGMFIRIPCLWRALIYSA